MRNQPPRKIRLIVNPAAGRGLAERSLPAIARAFAAERIVQIALTEKSGDEAKLAEAAISDGIETIVAVGGDGTCALIANALLARASSCRLAVVPVGTGNDFAKTLGTNRLSHSRIARLCGESPTARMDVGRAGELYFLNGCGFGIDPEILAATLGVTWLRGNAVYIWAALRKLFAYDGIDITDSANPIGSQRLMMVTVSNGRSLGGAFRIAPSASACDGLLDVHTFGNASPRRRLKVFLAALKGTHTSLAEVTSGLRASLDLEFTSPPAMEVDGELVQAAHRQLHIECVPGALSVVAAPGFPL